MHISLNVDTRQGRKKIEVWVENLSDLNPPLRLFGKYLRDKTKTRFQSEGPGWAGLADSTRERLEHTHTGRITKGGKIRQTSRFKGIIKRLASEDRNTAVVSALKRVSRSTGGGKLGQLIRASSARGQIEKELLNVSKEAFKAQSGKRRKSKRRAIQKHKLLGRLASTIKARVQKNRLEVYSTVPWAGVHNKGGTAGKGSRMPPRTFLELEADDVDVLGKMIVDHVTKG